MKWLIGFAWLLASASASASALTVTLGQPGYFAIDGRYYLFDLPEPAAGEAAGPVELRALGALDGFYLVGYLSASACEGGDPAAGTLLGGGLRHGELPELPDAPRLALDVDAGGLSSLSIARCDGTLVLLADSGSHVMHCGGSVPFPFKRGQCPGLDAADHGHVFFDAFEAPPAP